MKTSPMIDLLRPAPLLLAKKKQKLDSALDLICSLFWVVYLSPLRGSLPQVESSRLDEVGMSYTDEHGEL